MALLIDTVLGAPDPVEVDFEEQRRGREEEVFLPAAMEEEQAEQDEDGMQGQRDEMCSPQMGGVGRCEGFGGFLEERDVLECLLELRERRRKLAFAMEFEWMPGRSSLSCARPGGGQLRWGVSAEVAIAARTMDGWMRLEAFDHVHPHSVETTLLSVTPSCSHLFFSPPPYSQNTPLSLYRYID